MSRLALVVHFHQPVGNLDSVVRHATDRCYRPFLEVLDAHPDIPMTLHYSGCLLEWLETDAPDVTETIGKLVERGQVELMTGGFYEPILAALPARDQRGQIRMMSDHLASRYGADATGLWLTERVWEQDVIPSIVDGGVRYTVIDDSIFHSVGITDEELTGPFVTEHASKPLLVYAGDRELRYLIPYKRVERAIDHLRSDDRLFVYADDGEKFGEWPDTYERVYGNGWLERFFTALGDADDIELTTLGSHAIDARPRDRVYLPSSSYDEMMTWALPAQARLKVGAARRILGKKDPEGLLPFVRGAPWRAFLAKYPEVNQLQKRMTLVSNELHSSGAGADAMRELYRAQCNCAYWHGAFGGMYLAFMRSALWHHLMRAEGAVAPKTGVSLVDVDADARDEILITAGWGAAVVSPADARVIELDEWSFGANLLAVAARHREAYHLADENPIDDEGDDDEEMPAIHARADVDRDSLTFDDEPLGGLIDLIDGERVAGPYDLEVDAGRVVLTTQHVVPLQITKELRWDGDGLLCTHTLENRSRKKLSCNFGSESSVLPLNLGRGTAPDKVEPLATGWRIEQPEGEVGLEVVCEPVGEISTHAIETASATLEGLTTMRQGTTVTTTWHVVIPRGGAVTISQLLRPIVSPVARHKKEPGVSA